MFPSLYCTVTTRLIEAADPRFIASSEAPLSCPRQNADDAHHPAVLMFEQMAVIYRRPNNQVTDRTYPYRHNHSYK